MQQLIIVLHLNIWARLRHAAFYLFLIITKEFSLAVIIVNKVLISPRLVLPLKHCVPFTTKPSFKPSFKKLVIE